MKVRVKVRITTFFFIFLYFLCCSKQFKTVEVVISNNPHHVVFQSLEVEQNQRPDLNSKRPPTSPREIKSAPVVLRWPL